MPRVPKLEGPSVQAQPLAAPMQRAPVSAADGGGMAAAGMVQGGQQLQGLGQQLGAFVQKVRTREDAVARAGDFSAFNEAAHTEFLRLGTEADWADVATYQGYSAALSEKMTEIVENHQGTPESRAALQERLEGVRSSYVQRAAGVSAEAGQKRVGVMIGDKIASYAAEAAKDPDRINDLLLAGRADIADFAAAMSPEQEISMMEALDREITLSSITALAERPGGADLAAELIEQNPGLMERLTPDQQRKIGGMFAAAEAEKTRALREANEWASSFKAYTGREPTLAERVKRAGGDVGGPKSMAQQKAEWQEAFPQATEEQLMAKAGLSAPAAQTQAGKLVQDEQMIVSMYGADSPQVQAFREAASSDSVKLSDVAGVRKEFTRESAEFMAVRGSFLNMQAAAKDKTAAGDMALIFAFSKLLDPASVVREGEFATVQNTAGVPDRVINMIEHVKSGNRLSDTQRTEFIREGEKRYQQMLADQKARERVFRGIATRGGMNPDDVIVDFTGEDQKGSGGAAGGAGGSADGTLKMPAVGDVMDGYRFKGGDPSKETSWERAE